MLNLVFLELQASIPNIFLSSNSDIKPCIIGVPFLINGIIKYSKVTFLDLGPWEPGTTATIICNPEFILKNPTGNTSICKNGSFEPIQNAECIFKNLRTTMTNEILSKLFIF